MEHRDGRHVIVETTVEVLERMIGVAHDTSLAERWRTLAALVSRHRPERAATLRFCADELVPARQPEEDAEADGVVVVSSPPGT
jgi:hypothetical protein